MNHKIDILKESSAMLLASVLIAGFIGISSPFSIFAQEYYDDDYEAEYSQYYDDYETEYNNYESYMKDDDSRPNFNTISCNSNNININPPVSINIDTSDGPVSTNGEAVQSNDGSRSSTNEHIQSAQTNDDLNEDIYSKTKSSFVHCDNNNNNIQQIDIVIQDCNIVSSQDAVVTQTNELEDNDDVTVTQANTPAVEGEGATIGDVINAANVETGQNTQANAAEVDQPAPGCTDPQTQDPSNDASITDNRENDISGTITSSSIANVEQPQAQTQQIKLLQNGEGVEIKKQGNQPIDIRQINNGIEIKQQGNLQTGITQQLESLSVNDSPTISQGTGDLTALEKTTKLKQQWLELLP